MNLAATYKQGLAGVTAKEAGIWIRKSAENDSKMNEQAQAQFMLADMLRSGDGMAQNTTEAAFWYRAAAENGHAEAQCLLADLLREGDDGVSKNQKKSVYWLRPAAKNGYARAQCNLGAMLNQGTGVQQNETEAMAMFHKAAMQGNVTAQVHVGHAFTLPEANPDRTRATQGLAFLRQAAARSSPEAVCYLGLLYETQAQVGCCAEKPNDSQGFLHQSSRAKEAIGDMAFGPAS